MGLTYYLYVVVVMMVVGCVALDGALVRYLKPQTVVFNTYSYVGLTV